MKNGYLRSKYCSDGVVGDLLDVLDFLLDEEISRGSVRTTVTLLIKAGCTDELLLALGFGGTDIDKAHELIAEEEEA